MNPVKNIMTEAAGWDRVEQARAPARAEGEFGRFFETARFDIAEPVKVRRGARNHASQERLEKVHADQARGFQEPSEIYQPDTTEPQEDLQQDRNLMFEPKVEDTNNEAPGEQAQTEDDLESDVAQVAEGAQAVEVAAPEALSEHTEAFPAAHNGIMKEGAGQQASQSKEAAGLDNKGPEQSKNLQTSPPITELKVKVQTPESADLLNQSKQAQGENIKGEKSNQNDKVQVGSSGLPTLNSQKQGQGDDAKLMREDNEKYGLEAPTAGTQKSGEGAGPKVDLTVEGKSRLENQSANFSQEESDNANKEAQQKFPRGIQMQHPTEKAESTAAVNFSGRSTLEEGKTERGFSGRSLINQGKAVVSEKVIGANNLNALWNRAKPESADSTKMQENVDRIVKAARASVRNGSARIQIRLEPPELGYLRVEIKQSGNVWHLQLQATNVKAQQLLQQNSSELQAALESHGIQTRQIEVQLRLDLSDEYNSAEQQDAYQQGSTSEHAESYDQFEGDGPGQGGPEPSSAKEGDKPDIPAAAGMEITASKQWQELEYSRLDVKG